MNPWCGRSSNERQDMAAAPRPSTGKFSPARCAARASALSPRCSPRCPTLGAMTTSHASRIRPRRNVYLIDTDVISELRKKDKADRRVTAFFKDAVVRDFPLYLAAVT